MSQYFAILDNVSAKCNVFAPKYSTQARMCPVASSLWSTMYILQCISASICPVSSASICLVSSASSCLVSSASSCPVSSPSICLVSSASICPVSSASICHESSSSICPVSSASICLLLQASSERRCCFALAGVSLPWVALSSAVSASSPAHLHQASGFSTSPTASWQVRVSQADDNN